MAASVCKMEYPAPNTRAYTVREIMAGAAYQAAGGDEFHVSGKTRDLRTAHKAASLAEFAHDLCSPLSALAVLARSLRETTSDGPSEDIETIIRISEHTLGMVRDALDRVRIEAGCDVPRMEACDLQSLVGDVTDVSRPCARAKNLEFVVRRNPACPRYVQTDPFRIRRILTNLVENAIKYTQRGSVTLSLDSAESRDPERVWLIFEIRDTGIGIARKDQTRIFGRFVRGSGAAGTNGSGLGLTIVSQLVHLMGGTIRVESKPGAGSSFRIKLPVVRSQDTDGALPLAVRATPILPLEDVAALPYELRAELRESLLALDVSRIYKAIERIAQDNAALGAVLESHANLYAFTGIFEAVSIGL